VDAHTLAKQAKILNKLYLPEKKLIETVFWDRKGALMVEFLQHGATITSEVYCETQKILVC
jgi:hypothetical protein